MKANVKGKQVRLYIGPEDEARLDKLCEATGLSVTMAMTFLLSAGLRACAEAGNRLPLPLRFEIGEGVPPSPASPRSLPARK